MGAVQVNPMIATRQLPIWIVKCTIIWWLFLSRFCCMNSVTCENSSSLTANLLLELEQLRCKWAWLETSLSNFVIKGLGILYFL